MKGRSLGLVGLIVSALACGPADRECFREGQEIDPDDSIRGYVARDLLEGYFARYEGTLTWQDGGTTAFALDLVHEPDAPFIVYNLLACEPRNVGYWSPARITTLDGAFDTELSVHVSSRFPDAPITLAPDAVAGASALPDWAWTATLRARVPVDVSRYASPAILFELDWPPPDRAPTAGILDFYGSLASAPNLVDIIRLATIAF